MRQQYERNSWRVARHYLSGNEKLTDTARLLITDFEIIPFETERIIYRSVLDIARPERRIIFRVREHFFPLKRNDFQSKVEGKSVSPT